MGERGLVELILARLSGLSPKDKILLLEAYKGDDDLFYSFTKADAEKIVGHILTGDWNMDKARVQAEKDTRIAGMRHLNWVSYNESGYPPLLREIYDPPVLLFYRGSLPNPEKPLAAVVGTRRPSPQAAAWAFDTSRDLGHGGLSVVSGLALGIDAMAHRGNIEGGAPTYAVLGSGVDEVYPSANRVLARRLLETGGALLSEYPPGTGPRKWNFPARNRIIAGLARGVLIVEAPESSGALITARFALEQSRDLWVSSVGAAAGNEGGLKRAFFDRRGSAKLVENGAGLIHNAREILKEWNMESPVDKGEGRDAVPCGQALAAELARSIDIELEGKSYGSTG
jgi:DNA processing protein